MQRFKTLCTAIAVASCVALAACEGAESRKEKYISVGLEMMEKGELDKARISFKNVLKIDPKDIKANFYFAKTLEMQEDWPAAAAQYKHVIELDPANNEAAIAFGKILLLAKAADQVAEQAGNVLQRDPDNADAKILKAGALLLKGKEAEATLLIDDVVAKQPHHADAAILKSSVLVEARDYASAQSVLENAYAADRDNVPVMMLLSKVYSAQGKIADQESMLSAVIEVAPLPENYIRLSEFYFKSQRLPESERVLAEAIKKYPDADVLKRTLISVIESQNDTARAEKQIRRYIDDADQPELMEVYLAEKLFAWKRDEEAVKLLNQIAEQNSSEKASLSAMNLLALHYQNQGQLDDALALVNKVIERNANDAQALNFRARVSIEKGDYDNAITDLRTALNQEKRNPQLMKPLVVAYMRKGDVDLAADQVKTLLSVDPMNVETRILAAQVFEQQKNLDAVDEQLSAALRLQPQSEPLLQAMVGNAVQRQAWERVQHYTTRWLKVNPENPQAFYLRGLAEEGMGNKAEALANFNRSLAIAPGSIEPATAIVRMHLRTGNTADATKWLEAALQNGRSAHLLNLKGEVQLAAKNLAGARESFQESIALQPDWWVPYRTLGVMAAEAEDMQEAGKWFTKGIESARNSALLRAEYAAVLEKEGKPEAAIEQYRAIVAGSKSAPEAALNNLAMLLVTYDVDHQKIQEALALVARLENTQNPWYLDTVGWVYLKAGQQDKALHFIKRAADVITDHPVIQYHLGAAYFAHNDVARAETALQESLRSGKKFPGMKDAETLLKKIQSEPQQG